ncbi:MAG: DUF4157 domain-containing protein, partial [Cyanobacteria bacterium P01_D01_bin.115]
HSLGNFTIQPALAMGEPGDKYEQEADEIAGQAVQMKPQASAAAGAPEENSSGTSTAKLNVQHQLNPTAVQRQPDLDMGGSMPDLGGDLGGMGDMTDAMGGGMDELAGGGSGDLGGMADAMGGDGLEDMTDALGGGEMGDAMGAMGGNGEDTMTEEAGPETEEVEEMLGDTNVDMGLGDDGIEGQIRTAIASGGEPLPENMQAKLRSRIGMENPEDIRVHTDGKANELCDELGALAFTTGNHIFFAAGEYDPDSAEGQELIFHEAVHTIQQGAIDGSEGAAEEEAETNEAVAMQADDPAATEETTDDTATEETSPETEPTADADSGGEAQAESAMDQGADETQEAVTDQSEDAQMPSEVTGQVKGFLGKPPAPTEPAQVSPPAAVSDPLTPTTSMGTAESADAAADETSDLMGGGASGAFDQALGEVMTFAGESGADVLNLQAAPEATYDTASGQIEADHNPAGEWILNNMVLANTTGKAMEIYNRWGAVDDLPIYHKVNPLYYLSLALETVVMVLEIISGIFDVISLFLLGLMIGLYAIAGLFYGIGLLFNAIFPGAGAWAIAWATSIAQFTNSTFPPIFNLLDTWLVLLALMRIPLRIILMGMWLLTGLVSGFIALGMGKGSEGFADAMQDGASLAGNQVIGLAGDLLEVVLFNYTSQADNIGGDELLSIANPKNIGNTASDLGNDFLSAGKKKLDPNGTPTFKIVELRDPTGSQIWDGFDDALDMGDNAAVFNAIKWGDEGVKEVIKETTVDTLGAFAGGGTEFGQDAFKGWSADDGAIYGQAAVDENKIQAATAQAQALRETQAIQRAEGEDAAAATDNELAANYEATIADLPELELETDSIEDSPANDLAGAMQGGAIAQAGIIQLEGLAGLKEQQLEGLYYGQLELADRAAFSETAEAVSSSSLEQNESAEGMLDSSAGDVQGAQDDSGDMAGMAKVMSTIFGPLMSVASIFTPVDSGDSQAATKAATDSGDAGQEQASAMPGGMSDGGKQLDESKKQNEGVIADAQQSQQQIAGEDEQIAGHQAGLETDLADIYASLDELYSLNDEAESAKDSAAAEQDAEMETAASWAEETLDVIHGFWEENEPENEGEAETDAEEDEDTLSWEELHEVFMSLSLATSDEAQASAGS